MSGLIVWITGMSGSGKTTIGKILKTRFNDEGESVFWFDGDRIREALGNKWGYSDEERHELAWVYAKLVKELADCGITVVCSVVALFDDIRKWNRNNNHNYFEVYLNVPIDTLIQRDKKGLYSKQYSAGILGAGEFNSKQMPKNPDLIINNFGKCSPEISADLIYSACKDIRGKIKKN